MAVLDNFFIKVNSIDNYSPSGSFKSLRELHTLNGQLYPIEDLSRYYHPVISELGDNPNAFKQVYSTSTQKFINTAEGIEFPNDLLSDAVNPIVSEKLYKTNEDYPLMNLYMVKLLDFYSKPRQRVSISAGTYHFDRYGCKENSEIPSCGIIEIQGGGGGSGGTNNSGDDSGGGGGGAGAFSAVYYRVKNNPYSTITMQLEVGSGGNAGASGSGTAGTGGMTKVTFTSYSGDTCSVSAYGGLGGTGGNTNYTNGGAGGGLAIQKAGATSSTVVASGGAGGSESNDTAGTGTVAGAVSITGLDWDDTSYTLIDDDYLVVVVLKAKGGAGGGRGDDTGGKFQAKNGGNSFPTSLALINRLKTVPYSCDSDNVISYSIFAGGTAIESYSGAGGGGGGASVFAKGGNSGASSSIGIAGTLGSGAGGSGIGGNSNRVGANGGAGVAYIYI